VNLLLQVDRVEIRVKKGAGDWIALEFLDEHLSAVEIAAARHLEIDQRIDSGARFSEQVVELDRIEADRDRLRIASVADPRNPASRAQPAGHALPPPFS
jgi:hypothetical protein